MRYYFCYISNINKIYLFILIVSINMNNILFILNNYKKMQPSSSLTDYIVFKDEILKKIRLLENKFTSEFNSKFSQLNGTFEMIDTKIKNISQNNDSILEQITNQDFNYDKIKKIEKLTEKADQTLINHDVKIKNILQEIEKIKIRYDKIINENLIIPGCVGPGGIYKNLADYIHYQLNEFQKIRNDTEQTKKKVDNSANLALNVVKNAFTEFQKYTNDKNNDTQIMIEKKYTQFSDKILELQAESNKYQFKIEKQLKSMQNDIEKLMNMNKERVNISGNTFNDINQKVNNIIEDFDIIKAIHKDWDVKIKNYKQNSNLIDSFNKKNSIVHNSPNSLISKTKISQKPTKKILLYNEIEAKNSSIINNNNDLQQLKNNINIIKKNSFSLDVKKVAKSNNDNIEKSNDNNNNQKNQEIISNKVIDDNENNKNVEKNILNGNVNNININNNINNNKGGHSALKKKEQENRNENTIEKLNNNKAYNNSLNKNKELEKNKIIDKGDDKNYLLPINKEIKKFNNNNNNISNNNNNDKIINKKIIIDSINKQKSLTMSQSFMNINRNKNKKNKNKENISLKAISQNILLPIDKYEDKKTGTLSVENSENKINKNDTKKINNNSSNYININANNNLNLFAKTSKHSFLTKNESNFINNYSSNKNKLTNLQMNVNEEQQQIMKKIREYYNNKKELIEKKMHEKIVDCNVVNLNSEAPSDINNNNRIKYSSAKSILYTTSKSKINENRNILREIALKINPGFGRTNYRFFSRKDRMNNTKSVSSYDNKSTLKENF